MLRARLHPRRAAVREWFVLTAASLLPVTSLAIESECELRQDISSPTKIAADDLFVRGEVLVRAESIISTEILNQALLTKASCDTEETECTYRFPENCGKSDQVARSLLNDFFFCARMLGSATPIVAAPPSIKAIHPIAILRPGDAKVLKVSFPKNTDNDPYFIRQVALQRLGAEEAWAFAPVDSKIITAVIDDGIDLEIEDLKSQLEPGVTIPCDPESCDGRAWISGHGTAMAGTIAAGRDNGGIIGAAWNTRLLPIKATDRNAGDLIIRDNAAAKAIGCAKHRNARVMNLSMAGGGPTPLVAEALDSALGNATDNFLLVVPAGNLNRNIFKEPVYPAFLHRPNMLVVMSHDRNGNRETRSGWGKEIVDISAPGHMYSTWNCHGGLPADSPCYDRSENSTSNATAYVSGAAALLWSAYPDWSYVDIKWRILRTADPARENAGEKDPPRMLNLWRMMQPVKLVHANAKFEIGKTADHAIDTSDAFPAGMCKRVDAAIVSADAPSGALPLQDNDLKKGLAIRAIATCQRDIGDPYPAISPKYTITD